MNTNTNDFYWRHEGLNERSFNFATAMVDTRGVKLICFVHFLAFMIIVETVRLHRPIFNHPDLQSSLSILIIICLFGFTHLHSPGTWYFVGWNAVTVVVLKMILLPGEKQAIATAAFIFLTSLVHVGWITMFPLATPRIPTVRVHD